MTKLKEYAIDFVWLYTLVMTAVAGQSVGLKMSFTAALPMSLALATCGLLAIVVKNTLPKKMDLPVFAWAMILGLLFSMGDTAISRWLAQESTHLTFIATTTAILAFAGLSMIHQIAELKKLSWRVVVIAVFVFVVLFFSCAGTAHIVMKLQGQI